MQLTLEQAIAAGTEGMATVERHAGEAFRERARFFVLRYLQQHGATPGEVLTEACCAAGIKPPDTRAFGSIFLALSRRGQIRKVGTCFRLKGHGTTGGNVWELVEGE